MRLSAWLISLLLDHPFRVHVLSLLFFYDCSCWLLTAVRYVLPGIYTLYILYITHTCIFLLYSSPGLCKFAFDMCNNISSYRHKHNSTDTNPYSYGYYLVYIMQFSQSFLIFLWNWIAGYLTLKMAGYLTRNVCLFVFKIRHMWMFPTFSCAELNVDVKLLFIGTSAVNIFHCNTFRQTFQHVLLLPFLPPACPHILLCNNCLEICWSPHNLTFSPKIVLCR